ncbi:hypothetical protein [Blastochloris tepida]|uniref:Uncharacterized protein n=1 Tax=Blastochloris tepida TaxID=2233851 RepID=A0A348G441_9HYPH|nr:hypothetical protein [Blastochloris tepida]BBF94324.1 hypothetical protein BLTE_30090 [Blastochloris tepida]
MGNIGVPKVERWSARSALHFLDVLCLGNNFKWRNGLPSAVPDSGEVSPPCLDRARRLIPVAAMPGRWFGLPALVNDLIPKENL